MSDDEFEGASDSDILLFAAQQLLSLRRCLEADNCRSDALDAACRAVAELLERAQAKQSAVE